MKISPAIIHPAQDSRHYKPYLASRQYGNIASARLISVGGLIEQAQINIQAAGISSPAEFVDHYDEQYDSTITQYAADQVGAIPMTPEDDTSVVRRIEMLGALAKHIVLLPKLMKINSAQSVEERKKLISSEGIYGQIGSVIESTYDDIGLHFMHQINSRHDMGHMTELTALALLNRPQSPSFVALPSLPAEDRLSKDDVMIHIGGKYPKTYGYQLKTDEARISCLDIRKGHYIGGIALGNGWIATPWGMDHRLYRTSEAILSDLNGTLCAQDETVLQGFSEQIRTATIAGKSFVELRAIRQ